MSLVIPKKNKEYCIESCEILLNTEMTSSLLLPQRFQQIWIRSFGQHNKKHIYKRTGNVQQYEGIKFYPKWVHEPADGEVMCKVVKWIKRMYRVSPFDRDASHKDPEVPNPPKAFRVQRIVGMRGLPFWERRILKDLGLIYSVSVPPDPIRVKWWNHEWYFEKIVLDFPGWHGCCYR